VYDPGRDGGGVVFEVSGPRHPVRADVLHEADAGLPGAVHGVGISKRAGPQQVHAQIELELLVRPRIRHQFSGALLSGGVHEPWTAPPGP
jgi:hypothetical protein